MTIRTIRRCTILGSFLGLLAAVLFIAATDAQAHGTHHKCKSNGVKSKGTTKVHVHHAKPSKRHMRRHKCVKRPARKQATGVPKVSVQPEVKREIVYQPQIIYVPQPTSVTCDVGCPAPCSECQPKSPKPESCECRDTHKHQRGEGHRKCKGKGHYKDRDDD